MNIVEIVESKKNTIACWLGSSGVSGYDFNIIKKQIEFNDIEINYLGSYYEQIKPKDIIVHNRVYTLEYQRYLKFEIKYLDKVVKNVSIKYLYDANGNLNTHYLKESLNQHLRDLKINKILKLI